MPNDKPSGSKTNAFDHVGATDKTKAQEENEKSGEEWADTDLEASTEPMIFVEWM